MALIDPEPNKALQDFWEKKQSATRAEERPEPNEAQTIISYPKDVHGTVLM